MSIEVGRICVKQRGREKGGKCVVIDVIDRNYVVVTGPKTLTGIRRRRVNIGHLKPLKKKISIGKGASDDEVIEVLKKDKKEGLMKGD